MWVQREAGMGEGSKGADGTLSPLSGFFAGSRISDSAADRVPPSWERLRPMGVCGGQL